MRKTNHLMAGAALLALAATIPTTAMAGQSGKVFCVGCYTGSKGLGVDFNPVTLKTVYVFGGTQIDADPVTNTKTVTQQNGTVVIKQFPVGSHRGGPTMGLARVFLLIRSR